MTAPFEPLVHLTRLGDEPGLLAILAALSACERADMLFLRRITGLSKADLASRLAALEAAGLVEIERRVVDRQPRSFARLTGAGREAIEGYWKDLEARQQTAARRLVPKTSLAPAPA